MKITYRKAVKSDFKSINDLFMEMLNSIYNREDSEGYIEHDLDYYFEGKKDWICLALDDARIVGFLSIEVHHEETGFIYLDDFSVTKDHRNKGIGKSLINIAEQYAKDVGINTVLLHVDISNTAAYDLYTKLGYYVSEKQDNRYLMRKDQQVSTF